MKKLKSYEIRQMWLDFFQSKGHQVLPSASLIPVSDPTLLWINAGVAPLKKYFDGRERPNNPRMCNAQKSIRTNDIDNVGKTARHHTFFEMLGNFSIGDYFREGAIEMACELLFDEKWFGLDRERVYITYYPDDKETYQKWVSSGIDPQHLIPLVDNFWEIGEGPCGPDTEIFFDRGEKYDPQHLGIKMLQEDIENDRYIEIWNIVLSQFNAVSDKKRSEYAELPSKNIDTGSGLERLACIFQETETNYETDLFMPMIEFLEKNTNCYYHEPINKMAFRVIVDHVRSVTFAIADGAMFSNEGRGYVLRRILRRAVRYGKKLGINKPFLYQLVAIVVDNMKSYYHYLVDKKEIIEKIVKTEEENFLKTLESGEKKLQEIINKTVTDTISGNDAFLLYDTFGFPIELTIEIAEDAKMKVDIKEFSKALENQKDRARNALNKQQSMNIQNEDYLKFDKKSQFIGYNQLSTTTSIIGIFKDGKNCNLATGLVNVVFDKTPFYALSGGQTGDRGIMIYYNNAFTINDTFKLPNLQHAHVIDLGPEQIKLNDEVIISVDENLRFQTACNHSATHLLNQALREVLGNHVVQQGSQVTSENLRFDFNHYQNLTSEDILKIEAIVNEEIGKNHLVKISETTLENAKKMGAQAEFGEKYGETVRLIDMDFSKELCGGTHVNHTGEIKKFAIGNIESKGSGIFRIEASSNVNVIPFIKDKINNFQNEIQSMEQKIMEIVKKAHKEGFDMEFSPIEMPNIIGSYQDILTYRSYYENIRMILKETDKKYENLMKNKKSIDFHPFMTEADTINGTNLIITSVNNIDIDVVKELIDNLALQYTNCLIFIANVNNDKVTFVSKAKGNNIHCGMLVKEAAIITGGNGGGRPDFAQAGGKNISKVPQALQIVKEKVKCDI